MMIFAKKKSGDSLQFAMRIYDEDNQFIAEIPEGLQVHSHLKSAQKIGGETADEVIARFEIGAWENGHLLLSLPASQTRDLEGVYACDVWLSIGDLSLHSETLYFEFEKGVTHAEAI